MIAKNGHRSMVHYHCYDKGSKYDKTVGWARVLYRKQDKGSCHDLNPC